MEPDIKIYAKGQLELHVDIGSGSTVKLATFQGNGMRPFKVTWHSLGRNKGLINPPNGKEYTFFMSGGVRKMNAAGELQHYGNPPDVEVAKIILSGNAIIVHKLHESCNLVSVEKKVIRTVKQ